MTTAARSTADLVQLLGGVFFAVADPVGTARSVARWISDGGAASVDHDQPDHQLLETARQLLQGMSREDVKALCLGGAAWALGYRAAPDRPGWEAVITQPNGVALPTGVARTTGETILGIINGARNRVVVASPFVDRRAVEILAQPLLAAAGRGVAIRIVTQRSERAPEISRLVAMFDETPVNTMLTVQYIGEDRPWPHLKVVLGDNNAAYIGSANLTGNALLGRNLELGVLLRGDLSPIEAVLHATDADSQ